MPPHLFQDGAEVHGHLDDLVVTQRDGLRHRLLEPAVGVHLRHRRPRRLQRLTLSGDALKGGTRWQQRRRVQGRREAQNSMRGFTPEKAKHEDDFGGLVGWLIG